MRRIVLISCTKTKKNYTCPAGDMYLDSDLFSSSLAYAKTLSSEIYVISAKYGLLALDQVIDPYDVTLSGKSQELKERWATYVVKQLTRVCSINNTEFIILAGKDYYCPLTNYLPHSRLPLLGMPFRERIEYMKKCVADVGQSQFEKTGEIDNDSLLHKNGLSLLKMFCLLPRFHYNQIDQVPFDNGIYIMFEKNEKFHDLDRVVRIGTHRAEHRLKKRLQDHFVRQKKDDSIFRKNIGRAYLNKENDPYLDIWNLDTKCVSSPLINTDYEEKLEGKITTYLQENITFTCIPVETEEHRLRFEDGIIALLNQFQNHTYSEQWLGKFSSIQSIRNSGMWLVDGLRGTPLNSQELEEVMKSCIQMIRLYTGWNVSTIGDMNKVTEIQSTQWNKPCSKVNHIGVNEVVTFLNGMLENTRRENRTFMIIKSGDIHKTLNLKNRMPTVCEAMYKIMKHGDQIIYQPPKGRGSRLEIKYYV